MMHRRFIVAAAVKFYIDPPITVMGTAMGEHTANIIQSFGALPILVTANLRVRSVPLIDRHLTK
jgi:short subunit fatty acids transporter